MTNDKPYKEFAKPTPLAPEATVLGVSVKDWHDAFTSHFEENLKVKNEILEKLKTSAPEK